MFALQPLVSDEAPVSSGEILALGQDLAFIGVDLDEEGLFALLDEALLSDAEWLEGPGAWAGLRDPFPAWPVARRDTA